MLDDIMLPPARKTAKMSSPDTNRTYYEQSSSYDCFQGYSLDETGYPWYQYNNPKWREGSSSS